MSTEKLSKQLCKLGLSNNITKQMSTLITEDVQHDRTINVLTFSLLQLKSKIALGLFLEST